jgi:hypothetical protein
VPETIATLAFTAWRITPKTVWSFVEAVTVSVHNYETLNWA